MSIELKAKNEQLEKQKKINQALEQKIQQMSLVKRKDAGMQFNYLIPMSGKFYAPFI